MNGLRSYGTEPQVWGGAVGCEHEWGDEDRVTRSGGVGKNTITGGINVGDISFSASTGSFCRRCGAWRGHLGLESTPALCIEHMVEVFREVRRVLRKDGTCWVNMGDSYTIGGRDSYGSFQQGTKQATHLAIKSSRRPPQPAGLKPKDLIGMPWRLAFALQEDGWYLRRDIIWSKPNPMPESVDDRCTTAHEYLFHLTKSARYFYDAEAIKEEAEQARFGDYGKSPKTVALERDGTHGKGGNLCNSYPSTRNRRSVWTIATAPFAEAHFATFPPKLVEPCILAGTSAKGVCAACGAPWTRAKKRVHSTDDLQSLQDRAGRNGFPASARQSSTEDLPLLRSRGTAAAQAKKPSEGKGDGESLSRSTSRTDGGAQGCLPERYWTTPYAGSRQAISPNGTRQGNQEGGIGAVAQNGKGKGSWQDTLFEATRPALVGKWTDPADSMAGDHQDAKESMFLLPQEVHQEATSDDGSYNRAKSGRGSHAGEHRGRLSIVQFEQGKQEDAVDLTEWLPSCGCQAAVVPATCLDPFLGSGTTALVADRLGRNCIGIELSEEYAAMTERRLRNDAGLFYEAARCPSLPHQVLP